MVKLSLRQSTSVCWAKSRKALTPRGRYRGWRVAAALLLLVAAPVLLALQRYGRGFLLRDPIVTYAPPPDQDGSEFYFTRLVYDGGMGRWGWRGGWATDYPKSEYHFMKGVQRLTNIDAAGEGKLIRPLEDEIFEYPWLYAVEVGRWYLTQEEADHIREYLLRGGFLMVDDFHGTYQWAGFLESMQRVFPERPILEIEEDAPILHVLYSLDQRIQIPGRQVIRSGRTYERDGIVPHWRGIYDDEGRLMVAINFNMDLGDAWEHADWPEYPEPMTALAYRFGINYIVYAMTH